MLQTLANLGEFLGGMAVIAGVVFAVIQIRQYREGKHREIALELLRSFQTPDFARALRAVYNMPEGLTKAEIEAHLRGDMDLVYALSTTWESLGVLVFRRELDLGLVDDFFSGPITISWNKLEPYFLGERKEQNRETIGEWFEWLAGQMRRRESTLPPIPAHIAHKDWE
ncbi:MAG: hypothetical protein HKO65_13560 [Gemmatimonadetes bacterium]|nr:hypothetical protein [Gemmatimonadota bacterium]